MRIKLSKDKANKIRDAVKSQIEGLDLKDCSLTVYGNGQVEFVLEQTKPLYKKVTEWAFERADILLLVFLLLLVYIGLSCARCECKSGEPPQTNNVYTETTVCHKTFELPNRRVVTNSIEVTHSVTNEFSRP